MYVYPIKSIVILVVNEDKLSWTNSKTFHDHEGAVSKYIYDPFIYCFQFHHS